MHTLIASNGMIVQRNSDTMYYNKRGRLTRYALSCGYVERYCYTGIRCTHEVRMEMRDCCIMVRSEIGEVLYAGNNLTQARATYDAEVRAIKHALR